MPCDLPMEAEALLEYAERHGLLIYPRSLHGREDDEDHLNPDFLCNAKEVREELKTGAPNSFFEADQYDRWRLVHPQDVMHKLEKDYQNAQKFLEIAEDYLERFRERIAGSPDDLNKRA